jgi:ClpP class serine protease
MSEYPAELAPGYKPFVDVMRHEYRALTEDEKNMMQSIKDKGMELHELIESIGQSRELSIAKTKTEEAVMWAVKHLTK